ncbi:MAG: DUF6057 family protein [Dysgonamonadaceae bacterium]|jgi:hypothetical protein|nr:DUF6057 family protein [Dysgonamonadaceae bacterium]
MKEKNKKAPKKKLPRNISPSTLKMINIGGSSLFYIFSFCLLALYRGDFLFRLQELSIFLPTGSFFAEYMTKPAGFLFYISSFLLQLFYYPVLGAFIFTMLLALVQCLVYKSFPLGRNFLLVSLFPSALILLCVTQLDHVIYAMPDQEVVYTYLLGILFTLSLFLLYRSIKPFWAKRFYIILMACLFYPLIGFYALITVLLTALYEILSFRKKEELYVLLVLCLVTILFIPRFYYHFVYDVLNVKCIYFYGLPLRNFEEMLFPRIPVIALFVSLFLLPAFYKIKQSNEITPKTLTLNILAWVSCLLIVIAFTYRDKNFDIQLKMERALSKNDFEEILKIADKTKDVAPNRAILQYRNIALYRKGQLLDKMFTYLHGSAEHKSDSLASVTAMSAHSIFYHYGKLNFSYRWGMEFITKRGLSAEHLKYMAKVAMFNGETALAEKYFDILKQTLFHRKWAEENSVFLYDKNLFEQQEDYKKIYPLTVYNGEFWENSDNVESTNLTFYRDLSGGTREMFEHSIAAALTMKEIKPFMNKFQTFIKINGDKPIPVHLQEAAMLFIDLERIEVANPIKYDQHVVNRYKDFHRMVSVMGANMNEENTKKVQSKFGNTYWYYYFFSNGMKTN